MTVDMETRDAIRSVVENIPGICQLKPEQEECLVHILNRGDVVALLPTGFGKSLIYQLLLIVSEKLGRPKSSNNCDCVPLGCPHGRSGERGSKTRSVCCTAWRAQ